MSKITELGSRLERWTVAHEQGNMSVKVSSQGRTMLTVGQSSEILSFIDSMQLLLGLGREFKSHGFGQDEGGSFSTDGENDS